MLALSTHNPMNDSSAQTQREPLIFSALSELAHLGAVLSKQYDELACRFAVVLRCVPCAPPAGMIAGEGPEASTPLVTTMERIAADLRAAISKNEETINRCELPTLPGSPKGPAPQSFGQPANAGSLRR